MSFNGTYSCPVKLTGTFPEVVRSPGRLRGKLRKLQRGTFLNFDLNMFPRDFAWGAATAAYQIEGTVNITVYV